MAGLLTITRLRQADSELQIKRSTEYTTRFAKCIELIASSPNLESIELRLGAILAMRRLIKDSSDDAPALLEYLAAYVWSGAQLPRSESSTPPNPLPAAFGADSSSTTVQVAISETQKHLSRFRPDLQAALDILSRPSTAKRMPRLTNLSNCDFHLAIIHDAEFRNVSFEDSDFGDAKITASTFSAVRGKGCSFRNCDLTGSRFEDECDLFATNFAGANLTGCHMLGATLDQANFSKCDLSTVHFHDSTLSGTNLDGVLFFRSDGSSESDRGLTPAMVRGANNWKTAKFSEGFAKLLQFGSGEAVQP